MRIAKLAATVGLISVLAMGGTAVAQNVEGQAPQWMTLQQVHQQLEAAGYSNFEKIEREDDGYEVKATDPQGQRVELDLHPVTGEILKVEIKRRK
ncbi:MAG: PepSY domain-containing protein [Halopseudomonas yangmingensis]